MNASERRALLREEADAGRERIAEQQRQKEQLAESGRYDLRAAVAYDDCLRAERAYEAERRETLASAPASKSGVDGLLDRDSENNAPAAASELDLEAEWNAWLRGHLDIVRDEVAKALVDVIDEVRAGHEDIKKAIIERDIKIARLEERIEMLTRSAPSKSILLPDGKPHV